MHLSRITLLLFFHISCYIPGFCQELRKHITGLSLNGVERDDFSLIETEGNQFFFLGEESHRMAKTPLLTLSMLNYLSETAKVRIFAIEHGYSTAYLINKYLASKDTILLRQISRNTMFWGLENFQFLQDLANMNEDLSIAKRIVVASMDVEYKAESALLALNLLMSGKDIPSALDETLGEFQRIFERKRNHREQYDGLMIFHYYDRLSLIRLIKKTILQFSEDKDSFKSYFEEDYTHFKNILEGLDRGYVQYDYEKPIKNIKQRDDYIYTRFLQIAKDHPNEGIFAVIGSQHLEKGWSGYTLRHDSTSPFFGTTINIFVYPHTEKFNYQKIKKLDKALNYELFKQGSVLIKHTNDHALLKSPIKVADYGIFIKGAQQATPFKNSFYKNQ